MKFKAITIATLIFLAMMALGAVSAGENMTTDTGEVLEVADNSSFEVQASVQEDSLGEEEHTFSELKDYLGGYGDGDPVSLDKDYSYDDGNSTGGIPISDGLIIEGNGHTIDGKSKSRIFEIAADNVVLNNIVFVNGNSSALYINGASNVTISNCKFINCSSTDKGGAIYIGANDCLLLNCSFFNSSAKYGGSVYVANGFSGTVVDDCYFFNSTATANNDGGGAIYFGNDCIGEVTNCNFNNCQAVGSSSDGAAVYFDGYSNGNVTNCSFTNSTASDCGGAIYFSVGSTGNVITCNFVNSSAREGGAIYTIEGTCRVVNCSFVISLSEYGGAIEIYRASGDILNCSFVNSTAVQSGGAVYVDEDGYCDFVNCSFINSHSEKGGAICIDDAEYDKSCVVDGCSFVSSNSSAYQGGAIYFGTYITGEVTNCNFTDSSAEDNGGAIYFDKGGSVVNCSFTNCTTYGSGAVYFTSNGEVTNCNFTNNTAGSGGGAVYFYSAGTVTNCNFVDNKATGDCSYGGAVYFYSAGTVTNCNFVNNNADSFGAAVYIEEIGNVANCNFVNNSACECGAICFNGNGTVAYCNFTNNKATGPGIRGWGGAIFFNKNSDASVINCNFVNNTANMEGGAVYFDEYSTCTLTNDNFTNNTADNDGGAVYFWGTGNVTDCNFTDNKATNGGAVYFFDEGNVTNCNFTSNTADSDGGAVYFNMGATGEIKNCNFISNSADKGGAIFAFDNTTKAINSIFENNIASLGSALYNCNYEDCIFTANSEPEIYLDEQYRKDAVLNVNVENITFGEVLVVNIVLSPNITAPVTVSLNGMEMNASVVNGTGTLHVAALSAGIYQLRAIFNGTYEYKPCNVTIMFSVDKKDVVMAIETSDIFEGDDEVVTVRFNETVTGIVTVQVSGSNYTSVVVDGLAIILISGLPSGNYTATAHFHGDENYKSVLNSSLFTVTVGNTFSRLQTLIDGASDSLTLDRDYYGDGTTITISKAITIDGAGHVLDARKLSSIFTVSSNYVVITNMTLKNANSTGGGAIHIDSDSDLAVFDCRFINNSAQNGGDIYVSGNSHCEVGNCVFINSTAVQNGGVIFVESDASSIIGSSDFINSHAGKHGGALFVSLMGAGSVDTSYFFNSTAGQYGGAFYFSSETVSSATDCNLTNCSAVRGGAIYVEANDEFVHPIIDTCIFENCRATDGGAIFSEGKVEFRSSNFTNDIASNGCAVYIAASGSLTVEETSFNYCAAQASGGALYILGSADIRDSSFDGNTAIVSAGVAYVGLSGSTAFDNCNFTDSVAGQDGAFYIAGSANISGCRFNNSVSYFPGYGGGAISIYSNGSANIANSSFTGSASSANGGAIFVDNGSANVTGCNFTDSFAKSGGAIYSQGELEIRGCIFSNNTATTNGGAIFSSGETTAISSTFRDNTAGALGGAIYNCYYTDCTFESNTDPEIYFDEEYRKNITMALNVEGLMFGENMVITIILSEPVSANATAILNDVMMSVAIINGTGVLNISNPGAGTYNLTVYMNSTYEYNSSSRNVLFSVARADPTVIIEVNDTYVGDSAIIVVNVPSDAVGNISIIVDGVMIAECPVLDGRVSVVLPILAMGTHLVEAFYNGDDNYTPVHNETALEVIQNTFSRLQTLIDDDTTGVIELDRDYYGNSSEIVISKTITINGNGHTLNANGLSRIFNVNAVGVVIANLTFINGSADYGGAIQFSGTCTVVNCNFNDNKAIGNYTYGGAVYFENDGGVIDCNFVNNSASGEGGAVFFRSNGEVTNCNFTDNSASGEGGAVFFRSNGEVTNCNFANNSVSDSGGAIYFEYGTTNAIKNCNFINNYASVNGGAVYTLKDLTVDGSIFENNAGVAGAAIFVVANYADANLIVDDSKFIGNNVKGAGGAICLDATYGMAIAYDINGSEFTDNSAVNDEVDCCCAGGAIFMEGAAEGTIANSVFTANKVNSTLLPNGGAIKVQFGPKALIENCDFIANEAYSGAAIDLQADTNKNPEITIIGSTFKDNKAGAGAVAALSNYGEINLTIIDSLFESNAASISGGAVYGDNSSKITVSGTNFIGNNATDNGGAIFSFTNNAKAINSAFANNSAELGGAIYNCNYEDCTFIGNSEPEIYFDEQYRKDVIITVYAPDIMVGDILHLNITLSPNITAPVTVSLNGTEMNVSVVNGTGTLHVANLSAGNYPILAIFNGTYEYKESIASSSFTVSKYDSFVNITKTDLDSNVILDNKFVYGTEFLIEVTNNTAPVIVTINGAEYPVSEGKVVVNTAELSAGNYTVIARIPESGMFHASEQNMTFTITTKDVAITIETVNIFVDQDEIVTVIFNDNITCSVIVQISQEVKSGGQLPSGNQFISIGNFSSNGTSSVVPGNVPVSTAGFDMNYTIKIINGRGILNVSGLPSGKYTATAYFYGDENHNPAGASSNFTVSKYSTTLNITVDDIRVGEYPVVYIVFSDNITGNVSVSARPVGESSRVSSTAKVENGRANVTIYQVLYMQPSISLGDFIAGDYIIEVEFNGNERYNAVTASANLTVLKHDLNVSIDYSNDDKTVTVTPDSDITGNVTFTVAGSAYDVGPGGMTISLGHLASANYTYTVSYAGDDRYYMYLASDVIPLIRKATVMTVNVTDISYGQTENVEVTLPGDATGDMFFILLDWASDVRVNETLSVVNGKASLQIPNLSAGKYVLNVRYSGSNAYEPAESSANFTVSKLTLNVNVNFNNEAKTITITPSANIASNVTFMLGDIEYGVGPQGRTIDLSSLPSGNHTYTVSYAGDDRYKTYLASDVISVTRKEANVTVAVEDITYGESENVEAVVPEGATGEVVFVLFKNNMTYLSETVIPVNGIASWSMPDLDSGSYTLKATYSGDANYERSSIYEKKFSVAPNIDISPKVKIGDDGKIVIEFGNVEGHVNMKVNDKYNFGQDIIFGKFIYYLPTELLPVGDNNLTFEYIGTALSPNVFKEWDNEKQQYVPIKYLLHIAQRETEGAVDSSNDNVLEIVLEEDNKVLETATGQIEVEIINQFTGEIKKEVINVVNGIGKLDISQYKNGNYIINWKYTGDEKHAPISSQSRLTLTHKASRIAAGDVSMQYTTSKQYSVTVYGTDGKPLKDARITFLIDNKAVASATTNANGVARVSLSSVPGSHKLTVSAPGLAVTKKLTVSHIVTLKTAKIKRSAKKLVLTASLAKVNGKYLKSKSITFKINGKKVGSAKTNAKGVAKLTLKKTFLKKLKAGKKVKYQATYISDTVVKTTKVKK